VGAIGTRSDNWSKTRLPGCARSPGRTLLSPESPDNREKYREKSRKWTYWTTPAPRSAAILGPFNALMFFPEFQ
jgi:hypothetical protein